jgi:hypothetical protein
MERTRCRSHLLIRVHLLASVGKRYQSVHRLAISCITCHNQMGPIHGARSICFARCSVRPYIETEKKGRCRTCRKMFLEPDVPPSQKHTSIARGAGRQRVYAMPVSSRATCFRIAIPNSNISVRNARKLSPKVRKTFHYRNQSRGHLSPFVVPDILRATFVVSRWNQAAQARRTGASYRPKTIRKARDAWTAITGTPTLCILCLFVLR